MKLLINSIISLALIGGIIWYLGGVREVGGVIASIDPKYIVLIFAVSTLDRAMMTFKWAELLRRRGLHLPFFVGMKIYCASMLMGTFLPTTVGADAVRAISVSRTGISLKEVVSSIIIERMIGFVSALLLGLAGFIFFSLCVRLDAKFDFVWWTGGGMLVAGMAAFFVSFSKKMFSFVHSYILNRFQHVKIILKLRELHLTYIDYSNDKKNLVVFFLLTFVEQLIPIFFVWLIVQGLEIKIGLLYIAGVVTLTALICRIPVSIDSIGVFEGAFILLMSLCGVSAQQAVAVAIIGRIIQTASWLPWGLAYVLSQGNLIPQKVKIEKR